MIPEMHNPIVLAHLCQLGYGLLLIYAGIGAVTAIRLAIADRKAAQS